MIVNQDDNTLVSGTSKKDDIYNYGSNVTINAEAGNDNINNQEGNNVTMNGGDGDDDIVNHGSYVIMNGNAGDDILISFAERSSGMRKVVLECVTLDGGIGNDTLQSWTDHTLFMGGEGADSIYSGGGEYPTVFAGDGNDTIINYCEHALIYGEGGNDSIENTSIGKYSTIIGGAGDDTITWHTYQNTNVIQYAEGDGNDVVVSSNSYGPYVMNLAIVSGNYTVNDDGQDLLVIVGDGSIRFLGMAGKSININGTSTEDTTTTTPTTTPTSTTTTPITTTPTSTTTTPATTGVTVINNYYYGDVYNISGNSGTIVINSSVEGGVGNTVIINKEGDTYTYNGGDRVINNYQQGEVVRLDDYQGLDDISGNSFYIKSKSGRLEIQNSRDKFIGYSAGNSDVIAYSYVASGGGNVDGRGKSQAEILIGADHNNNQIFAGNGGSSVWGGNGGADTLVGGDVIQNAGSNDIVNLLGITLEQISDVSVSLDQVHINFTNGEFLQVKGNSGVGYRLQNQTYVCNQSTGQWSTK